MNVTADVTRRMRTMLRDLPRGLAGQYEHYIAEWSRAARAPDAPAPGERSEPPFWANLPKWMAAAAGTASVTPPARTVLADIDWAQFCLYLAIRVHDDVADRQTPRPMLVYFGDLLIIEAMTALESAGGSGSRLCGMARVALRKTCTAIAESDALQRAARPDVESLFRCITGVNAIFKIGGAAVCTLLDRTDLLEPLSEIVDDLSVGGQLVDDTFDLFEDLDDGRVNAAAALLITPVTLRSRAEARRRVSAALLRPLAVEALFDAIDARFTRAERRARALALPQLARHARKWRRAIGHLRDGHRQGRIEAFMRSLPRSDGANRAGSKP